MDDNVFGANLFTKNVQELAGMDDFYKLVFNTIYSPKIFKLAGRHENEKKSLLMSDELMSYQYWVSIINHQLYFPQLHPLLYPYPLLPVYVLGV